MRVLAVRRHAFGPYAATEVPEGRCSPAEEVLIFILDITIIIVVIIYDVLVIIIIINIISIHFFNRCSPAEKAACRATLLREHVARRRVTGPLSPAKPCP